MVGGNVGGIVGGGVVEGGVVGAIGGDGVVIPPDEKEKKSEKLLELILMSSFVYRCHSGYGPPNTPYPRHGHGPQSISASRNGPRSISASRYGPGSISAGVNIR